MGGSRFRYADRGAWAIVFTRPRLRVAAAFLVMRLASLSILSGAEGAPSAESGPRDATEESTGLDFEPSAWKFGAIDQGTTIRARVTATNRGESSLGLRFIPTCACLNIEPAERILAPGEGIDFAIVYDSADDEGKVSKGYIVETDPPSKKPIYYAMSGVVRASNVAGGGAWVRRSPGTEGRGGSRAIFSLVYYYVPGCRSCEEFLAAELPALEKDLGIWIDVTRRDALDPAAYRELSDFAASRGLSLLAMPALRAGDRLLQGEKAIRDELPDLLRLTAEGGSGEIPGSSPGSAPEALPTKTGEPLAWGLGFVSIALAGLVDGVNPCAFTTLIFLLASLALAGRRRREILLIGSLFSLGVFATYTAIGFGLFAALRAAGAVPAVGSVIRWTLAVVLLGLAAASVYDYSLVRRGRAGDILLQLPGFLKRRIHDAIRSRARERARSMTRSVAIAGSSFVLGFLVSIFEFACSGQVYLPTLAYLARSTRGGAGLLIAYNLFFIAPLLAVFAASYLGAGSERIARIFAARMGAVKLALAGVFLLLAALTVLV